MRLRDSHSTAEPRSETGASLPAMHARQTGVQALPFVASAVLYLGTLIGALWAANRMLLAGVWLGWAITGPFVVAAVLVHCAERVAPYRREWNHDQGDSVADWYHVAFSGVIASELYRFVFGLLMLPVAALIVEWRGASVWPADAPVVLRLALAVLVAEFGYYWGHRWGHRIRFLWRAHATHHSPERLYGLNFMRAHPLGLLLLYVGLFVPLLALGCDQDTLTLLSLFTFVHGLFQHCNIALRLGPLDWIFSSPALHRWHHSSVELEAQHNYGANLIVWDVVFGSRFLPADEEVGVLGIENIESFPKMYFDQMKVPFALDRLEAAGSPRKANMAAAPAAVAAQSARMPP